eukprot:1776565-Ditylum_brightwellii.AAC.1
MGNACYGYAMHPFHNKYDELQLLHIFWPVKSELWGKQLASIPGPMSRQWRSSRFMAMPGMPTHGLSPLRRPHD